MLPSHTPVPKKLPRLAGAMLHLLLLALAPAWAAPDEDLLGKAAGYPVAPRLGQAYQEPYRVGSFSAMDSISPHCVLEPSIQPQPLPRASSEPRFATDSTARH